MAARAATAISPSRGGMIGWKLSESIVTWGTNPLQSGDARF
jgi:hypothetical protein